MHVLLYVCAENNRKVLRSKIAGCQKMRSKEILKASEVPSFNKYLQDAIIKHWNLNAFSDYKGVTLQYHDVARKIEKLHILFRESGIKRGDKIALCGRSTGNWACSIFAIWTYGAVAVPLLNEFTPEQIHNCVNHSDARLLFVGDYVKTVISPDEMPNLEGIINIPDFSLFVCRNEKLTFARQNLNAMFGKQYPERFTKADVSYYIEEDSNELALINYTSGTTGTPKGVMIPYRAMWSNLNFAWEEMGSQLMPGENFVSMLPLAHMFGLAFDVIYPFTQGRQVWFLNRAPSPALLIGMLTDKKPTLIITVPMVVEKIVRKKIFPKIQTHRMKLLLHTPTLRKKVKNKIRSQFIQALGGQFCQLVMGGAALNAEVEDFLKDMEIPYCVGYGATECAPLIAYSYYTDMEAGCCGRPVTNIEVRIDSNDPQNYPGEILVRGLNVMLGYYKNEEETKKAIDKDGWYHTGDLGVISEGGFLYIKGRIKNMLLSSNGQNIYPEEIEDKLNSLPFVLESIVVQRKQLLVALVYPDYDEAAKMGLDKNDLQALMTQENLPTLNSQMPTYSKVAKIELRDEEFEKTAKKSIRRFLYK